MLFKMSFSGLNKTILTGYTYRDVQKVAQGQLQWPYSVMTMILQYHITMPVVPGSVLAYQDHCVIFVNSNLLCCDCW